MIVLAVPSRCGDVVATKEEVYHRPWVHERPVSKRNARLLKGRTKRRVAAPARAAAVVRIPESPIGIVWVVLRIPQRLQRGILTETAYVEAREVGPALEHHVREDVCQPVLRQCVGDLRRAVGMPLGTECLVWADSVQVVVDP